MANKENFVIALTCIGTLAAVVSATVDVLDYQKTQNPPSPKLPSLKIEPPFLPVPNSLTPTVAPASVGYTKVSPPFVPVATPAAYSQ